MTENAGRRVTVAVGLVDGSTKTGTLESFEAEGEALSVETATRGPGGKLDKVGVHIPTKSTSYVAFYREPGADGPPDAPLTEAKIYLPAGNSFSVVAETESLDSPLGFFGYPVSRASLYARVWFYRDRITAIEDATPLGELLIQQGLLQPAQLHEGTSAQAADRETPIGQILIEKNLVPEEQVEAFAAKQTRSPTGKRLRLGEILVEAGLATNEQISEALSEQRSRRGKRLGEVLVEAGIVSEEVIARTLALKFRLPYVDLDQVTVQPGAADEIAPGIIKKFRVFPFASTDREIRIAMADPTAVEALDMLRFSMSKRLKEVVVRPSQLEEYLRPFFPEENPQETELEELLEQLLNEQDTIVPVDDDEFDDDPSLKEEGAVTRLAYKVILSAYQRGASDIHIEPQGKDRPCKIRQRVDGECEIQRRVPPSFRSSLVARIKILAGLDITERRLPQDGKIRLPLKDRKLELRVATLPTADNNEDVVLRILAAGGAMALNDMGLSDRNFAEMVRLAHKPYGLLLVVGPTGSGKTTTLHSVLGSINTVGRKIWTAEDPVEITQPGLRQMQMKPRIGLTFATAMRAFLRADPDVIMVGEMRDLETASTGVEASLTGHLVLSTLHTNSAPETITRMVDMGLDPFTFSDALLGVLAQRLARRLCSDCKTPYEAGTAEIEEVHRLYGPLAEKDGIGRDHLTLWHAAGCESCGDSGYRGRLGIHEVLVADDDVRRTIQQGKTVDEIRDAAIEGGMRTLMQDGIFKCLQGATDLRQVQAVCSK
jgi:type II secretory ATPase GspE/PulE/Tfp pilus assembly ATPase PilB-like protein